jgi:hypothetical protein
LGMIQLSSGVSSRLFGHQLVESPEPGQAAAVAFALSLALPAAWPARWSTMFEFSDSCLSGRHDSAFLTLSTTSPVISDSAVVAPRFGGPSKHRRGAWGGFWPPDPGIAENRTDGGAREFFRNNRGAMILRSMIVPLGRFLGGSDRTGRRVGQLLTSPKPGGRPLGAFQPRRRLVRPGPWSCPKVHISTFGRRLQ